MKDKDAVFNRTLLDRLYQYACVLTKEPHEAYDLLQASLEKYLKLSEKERTLSIKNAEAFIKKIIRNHFIDTLRSSHAHLLELYDEHAMSDLECRDLESVVIDRIHLESIWNQLEFQAREILYYWAVMGNTAAEIATILDVPRGTVLSRLHRIKKRLQERSGAKDPKERDHRGGIKGGIQ